ncbi:TPA: hypothetical protein ACWW5J_004439 [Klebsiella pneumoniae]
MPAISEIKSQGNNKFPFSNTLIGEAAGGSPIPAAFLEEHPKQQITVEITSQQWTSKRIFQGSYIKLLLLRNPITLSYHQNLTLSRGY